MSRKRAKTFVSGERKIMYDRRFMETFHEVSSHLTLYLNEAQPILPPREFRYFKNALHSMLSLMSTYMAKIHLENTTSAQYRALHAMLYKWVRDYKKDLKGRIRTLQEQQLTRILSTHLSRSQTYRGSFPNSRQSPSPPSLGFLLQHLRLK